MKLDFWLSLLGAKVVILFALFILDIVEGGGNQSTEDTGITRVLLHLVYEAIDILA